MIDNENQQWLEDNNHDLSDDQFERFENLVEDIHERSRRSGYDMSWNQARGMAIQAFKDTI